MPNNIKNVKSVDLQTAYTTWSNDKEFQVASQHLNTALQNSRPIQRSTAAIANTFRNIDGHTSVRDSASRLDYDFFRPTERVSYHMQGVMSQCMSAYQKVPIIYQIINLMSEFTSKGIRLLHEDEKIQNFYREWFKKINGPERSERIANCLYRVGNVVIKRADAKLNPTSVRNWKNSMASTDIQYETDVVQPPYEVPYRYTILNPLIIEVIGEHLAAFTGKMHYVLKLPASFYNSLSLPLTNFDPSLLTEGLPRDLQTAIENNDRYLLLDNEKLSCLFYKKDDWDVWAYPMLYSLLDEVIMLQKMKLADMTALDGVISHIRVWKLGSMEYKIFPTDAAIAKLSDILLNHLAGGAMDLIWGPDLELAQTSTDIANFLGSEKYEFCMNTIHNGLGIPAAMGRSKGSMSDNFMQTRILMERLVYGRSVLNSFWEDQIRRVQQAMGFKKPAKIVYDHIVLNDETAEKALWLQLVDRDIVPVEAVQERFGRIPEIDNILIQREHKAREAGKMPPKVSPYTDAQPDLSLTKIGMQTQAITPSELPDKFSLHLKEPSANDQKIKDSAFPPPAPPMTPQPKGAPKPTGVSGQGRPSGSKDSKKRKQRIAQPSSKAEDFLLLTQKAALMQNVIAKVVDPYFLEKFGKASVTDLDPAQATEMEKYKFTLLLNTSADDTPKPKTIHDHIIRGEILSYDSVINNDYCKLCASFRDRLDRELTPADLSQIKSYIYALLKGQENNE